MVEADDERWATTTSRRLMGVLTVVTFVAVISMNTVVNALPRIISDLRGSQGQFTLVISAALVASVASSPVWGKLADVRDKKRLLQASIAVFASGSILCGLAPSVPFLIGFRAWQGIGLGGIQALSQVVIAVVIPPRQRGRYFGLAATAQAAGAIGGPLIGGLIVDSPLGWRWVFFIGVPFAGFAVVVLHANLHLPEERHTVSIDYFGAALLTTTLGLVLTWITMAGRSFDWLSWSSEALLGAVILATIATVIVESRVRTPIFPFHFIKRRTIALVTVASIVLGINAISLATFSIQYLVIGRSYSASQAGLMTIPSMVALLFSTSVSGHLIAHYGRWQRILVLGSVLNLIAFSILSLLDHSSSILHFQSGMVLESVGFGMTMQTLMLGAQNAVPYKDTGTATSIIGAVRMLGGAVGLSAVGAIIGGRAAALVSRSTQANSGQIQWTRDDFDVGTLPPQIAHLVRNATADAMGTGMQACAACALIGVVAVLFVPETALRISVRDAIELSEEP